MAQEKLTLAQRYEMAQSELQQLGSIITRIDERLEIFMQKHDKLYSKLSEHIELCPVKKQIISQRERIATLEALINPNLKKEVKDEIDGIGGEVESIYESLEKIKDKQGQLELILNGLKVSADLNQKHHEGKWHWVGQFAFQTIASLAWVLIALALYHFGIPAPPTKP